MPATENPAARAQTAADPTDVTVARRAGAPAAVVLAHGAALLLFLGFLRLEKALVLKLRLGAPGWVAYFLPEIVFVVLLASVWMLLALSRRRPLRLAARVGFPLVLLGVYALALVDHMFFLHTATRLRLELASYALVNLRMLGGLLGWAADAVLVWRLGLGVLLVLLAVLVGRRPLTPPRRRTVALWTAAAAVVAMLPIRALPVAAASLEKPALPEFFSGLRHSISSARRSDLDLVAPADLYQAPRVVEQSPEPPNLVLVLLESTGAGTLFPYDPAAREWAPALAGLAERSVVFENVYATVTHTSKALVGILCGFFPRPEMPITESLDQGLPLACAPELLAGRGYRTLFLQTALGRFENRPGLVRNLGYGAAGFLETLRRGGRDFPLTGYLGMDEFAMIDPAVDWAARGGPEPFLMTLLTISPHHPYQVPGEPLSGDGRSRYIETIRFQDRFVGALLERLREAGALEHTVVIVLGDHGESFGDHGRLQHDAVPYEEVVRVPLFISGPEELVGPPRTVGGLRHQIDLLPTLLGLAGIRWSGVLPGKDLLGSDGHPRVFSSCWYEDFCLAMREGDRKVIYHFGRRSEVFDLAADPGEQNDLAPALPAAEVEEAERRMLGFLLSIEAFWDRHPAPEGESLWWVETAH